MEVEKVDTSDRDFYSKVLGKLQREGKAHGVRVGWLGDNGIEISRDTVHTHGPRSPTLRRIVGTVTTETFSTLATVWVRSVSEITVTVHGHSNESFVVGLLRSVLDEYDGKLLVTVDPQSCGGVHIPDDY